MIVVLLQSSKGGGLAGAFGGTGGMGAIFGGRGAATFLAKATTVLAVLFMLSNIGHNILSKGISGAPRSIIQKEAMKTGGTSPAAALPGVPVVEQNKEVKQTPAGKKENKNPASIKTETKKTTTGKKKKTKK